MMGSCSSISLQVTRKGGQLMIGWACERVYTVYTHFFWLSFIRFLSVFLILSSIFIKTKITRFFVSRPFVLYNYV